VYSYTPGTGSESPGLSAANATFCFGFGNPAVAVIRDPDVPITGNTYNMPYPQ
jgi:hypothetical protein